MITLKELVLTNYRNIKHQKLTFDGNSKVVGENRIGKTNTIEALYWLLTDKLLNGSKDIDQIKPLDDTKAVVQVSATFYVDGKEIKISKEYNEEWVKTRGTEELIFKGHTTTYIYNGVKQGTKKEYDSLVATDFGINCKDYQGIDIMQMLVNPLYLGRMGDTDDWKNLRSMIIDIVGDVKDDDVFTAYPRLEPIKNDLVRLNGRTDQMVKGYRDELKTLKEDVIGCDANIQMLDNTENPGEETIEFAKKSIKECEDKFRTLKVDGNDDQLIFELDRSIMDLKNQIIELKRSALETKNANPDNAKRKQLDEEKNNLYTRIDDITSERERLLSDKITAKSEYNLTNLEIAKCQKIRHDLLDEYDVIKRQLDNPKIEKECPHCHRPYDSETIESTIAEISKTLNFKKDAVLLKGKENSDLLQEYVNKLKEQEAEISRIDINISRIDDSAKIIRSQIEGIDEQLKELNIAESAETINPQIATIEEQIKLKEAEKEEVRHNSELKEQKIREQIASLQEQKEKCQKVIDDHNFWLRSQEQKEKVALRKKDLMDQIIHNEQKVELVKDFIRIKLEMLDYNIRKVFDDVSFQLIEPQINGGYATVCKPYIKGTRTLWKSGSKSEQVTTGVAICEKIKAALKLPDLPFIFDEGGEISSDTFTTRFETKSQLICVQVKDDIMIPTVMNI